MYWYWKLVLQSNQLESEKAERVSSSVGSRLQPFYSTSVGSYGGYILVVFTLIINCGRRFSLICIINLQLSVFLHQRVKKNRVYYYEYTLQVDILDKKNSCLGNKRDHKHIYISGLTFITVHTFFSSFWICNFFLSSSIEAASTIMFLPSSPFYSKCSAFALTP